MRLIIADTALLLHVGELLGQLTRDNEWYEDEDSIEDVLAASWDILESWYAGHMIGQITQFIDDAPPGWLELDGTTYTGSDYPELFAKLPNGWTTSTEFTLPDAQDIFIAGVGSAGTIAGTGGANSHALTVAEMPAHTHLYTMPIIGPDTVGVGAPVPMVDAITPSTPTSSTGSGTAHENRPSFLALVIAIYAGRE